MVQLLHKLSIRAANGPHKLLKNHAALGDGTVRNPDSTDPDPTPRLRPRAAPASLGSQRRVPPPGRRLVSVPKFIPSLPEDVTHVYVAGALAHGKAEAQHAAAG
eukprot:scaffold46198_cov64-Phaeocystis_antarctica.AAC.3